MQSLLKPKQFLTLLPLLVLCLLIGFNKSHLTPSAAYEPTAVISGEQVKWHPITVSFDGPLSNEWDSTPNPFLDYRLQVRFTGPSGQTYDVPGFFDGNGQGGKTGTVWRVRFAADEAGTWEYTASFRAGKDVAISLEPAAGEPISPDGDSGSFVIAELDTNAPGFLSQGRLEYVGQHYLKFRDGTYWIKGGTDSPENFLAYAGFDFTVDQPGGLDTSGLTDGIHRYGPHVADWRTGDPNFSAEESGYDGKGIIGALNYLNGANVNSIYLLPMNLEGDGRDTYPFTGPENSWYNKRHYDLSKLRQWNMVLEHAQEQGIALNIVLAETEVGNRQFLDDGTLGTERKLYYRELIARFGHLLAIKWNLSEENQYPVEELKAFASYIQALDWQNHPIAVHTLTNKFDDYDQIVGDERFSASSIQYAPDLANSYVETWRKKSADAGHPWVLDMDENNPAGIGLTGQNAAEVRKTALYDIYFSGGNVEWYAGYHELPLGGDVRLEDFRTREEMWDYTWYARQFMQDNLPFWEMEPADNLLNYSSASYGPGQVFAKAGQIYAIYLPDASATAQLNLSGTTGTFQQRWYNPRTGQFAGSPITISGNQLINLGPAPADGSEDWVILLTNSDIQPSTPTPTLPPPTVAPPVSTATPPIPTTVPTEPTQPTATPAPPVITEISISSLSLVNFETGEVLRELNLIDLININELPDTPMAIRANVLGPVGSVTFFINGGETTDSLAPFDLTQNEGTLPWSPPIGRHTLKAVPFTQSQQGGDIGEAVEITLIVMDRTIEPATPAPIAGVERDIYLPVLFR